MGNYKANKNNLDVLDEKTQDEKNEQATQDVLKAGLDVAEHIPVASMYAKAAKITDKVTGGAITKGASKIVNQGLKNSPIGNQTQSVINSASESGLTGTVNNTANLKSGNVTANGNGKSILGGISGKTGSLTDGNIMGKISSKIPKSIKIKIYVGLGVFLFFIMLFVTVFAEDDEINLGATNNVSMSEKNNSTEGFEGEYGEGATYLGDVSSCGLTVKDGKYYKTVVPLTSSCNVSAFSGNPYGLEPSFYANIIALIEEGKAKGCNASIISGHRTYQKQAYLYNCYKTKKCNNGNLAAAPGRSNHEYAIAADLRYHPKTSACLSFYHNTSKKYGLHFPLLHASFPEDWHIEPINIVRGNP